MNDKKKRHNEIYIYSKKKPNFAGRIFSGTMTISLLCGIGFVGYSIAAPIFDYIDKNNDIQSASVEMSDTTVSTKNTSDNSDYQSMEEYTAVSSEVQTSPLPDEQDVTSVSSEETTVSETSVTTQTSPPVTADYPVTYYISEESMTDLQSFKAAVAQARAVSGCTAVVVPLKVTGGEVYYNSQLDYVANSGASRSSITLAEMVSIISAEGLIPQAEISTLEDSIFSKAYTSAAYRFSEGTWYDDDVEDGGKPWLSPYQDLTVDYLCQMAQEIADAGFKTIICSDVEFPDFRDSDYELLDDDRLTSSDRCEALTDLLADIKSTLNGKAELIVKVDAWEGFCSVSEVLSPSRLDPDIKLLAVIDLDMYAEGEYYGVDIMTSDKGEKAALLMEAFEQLTGKLKSVPCFVSEELDYRDMESISKAIIDSGYSLCYFE